MGDAHVESVVYDKGYPAPSLASHELDLKRVQPLVGAAFEPVAPLHDVVEALDKQLPPNLMRLLVILFERAAPLDAVEAVDPTHHYQFHSLLKR